MSSGGYFHLTKMARAASKLNRVPKHLESRIEKIARKSTPEFMKPALPSVNEEDKFQTVKEWQFLPGDRVVILKGPKRGNICVIKQHDVLTNGFILDENGPSSNVPVPKQFWLEGQQTHMLTVPCAVRQQDLRLVADIDDPASPGRTKTVAVKGIDFKGTYYDDGYKKMMPYRSVVGQSDLIVPWPKPEPTEDGDLGTEPALAREQTFWVDSIVKNPVPRDALLTVRNPRSKFRRGTLTARDVSKLVAPKMPLSETKKAYLAEKRKLAQRPKPGLTEEEKAAIGEKIYSHLKDHL